MPIVQAGPSAKWVKKINHPRRGIQIRHYVTKIEACQLCRRHHRRYKAACFHGERTYFIESEMAREPFQTRDMLK